MSAARKKRTPEEASGKYHKETFDKISDKKREKIIKISTVEFAEKGFNGANVNVIANKSGISIGSMYNYFSSKEHLFLTVVDEGYKLLEEAFAGADLANGDIFQKLETIIRVAQKHSRSHPQFVQLYQDITTESLAHLSARLSRKIENISAVFYRHYLKEAKVQGLVDPSIDDHVASFCIDNIIVLMQFSYTSEYYKERLLTFIGEDALEDDERVIRGMMDFIRRAIGVRK